MKKKTQLLMLLGTLWMMILSGCGVYSTMGTTIHADGSGAVTFTVGYDDTTLQTLIDKEYMTQAECDESKAKAVPVTVNNKTYYCTTETINFSSGTDLGTKLVDRGFSGAVIYTAPDTFFMYNEKMEINEEALGGLVSAEDINNMLNNSYMEISVTFPTAITSHGEGGVLSNDNKTITWDMAYLNSGKDLYATTANVVEAKPISANVKAKNYTKPKVIKISSGEGIVYFDGEPVKSGKIKAKNGAHIIIILNKNGTKQSIPFSVDMKAPLIDGAKDGKTYKKKIKLCFTDMESGIKSIKINGKKLSKKAMQKAMLKGYTIKKKGTYKVTVVDNVKHETTITFTKK